MTRQVFLFFQFNGSNEDVCNFHCIYCYGGLHKTGIHHWNGDIGKWTKAFERLNRDIYFQLGYGESMISKGFYEVLDMIGAHENWETSIVTNLSLSPQRLIESKLGRDRRVYVHASFHPLGGGDWDKFTKHLLMLQEAEIPTIVMYLFYPPQVELWKGYWRWLDAHNFRTCVRRWIGRYEGKKYPESYSPEVKAFFKGFHQPKTFRYGFQLKHTFLHECTAAMDMILVHYDGEVSYCADLAHRHLGNVFDPNFKLRSKPMRCSSRICGCESGMLHMRDDSFGANPERLWHDCFVAQSENITGGGKEPVHYPNRTEIEKWLLS
jgi:MoaA/NifB/PqqE/SkfB family radical SAM enzyme